MRRVCFLMIAPLLVGCEGVWNRGECEVKLSFSEEYSIMAESSLTRGGGVELPDTNDFILVIENESGEELFRDTYENRPEQITLPEGSYKFGVYSREFDVPAFDTPQFGDEQSVSLTVDGVSVSFRCQQLNSGMRCMFEESFTDLFPSSRILLVQGETNISYIYTEERVAYFDPGKVDIYITQIDSDRKLFTRNLEKGEVLTINFSADVSSTSGADFSIAVDTGRVWISENYVYGKERDGSSKSRALLVSDLPNMIGATGVWVKGYIVGGDLSSSSALYAPPFTSRTNFMISDVLNVSSREGCASVELKSGAVRDDLNLVDHPEYLGRVVYLKGKVVEAYFGLPGIKSVSEYSFN